MHSGITYYIELACILALHITYYILHTLSIAALVRTGCSKSGVILIYNGNTKSQITVNQESCLRVRAKNLIQSEVISYSFTIIIELQNCHDL